MSEETRAGVHELIDEKEALGTDFEATRNRTAELESELDFSSFSMR